MPDESTARGGSRKDGPILGPDEQTATRVGDFLVDDDTGSILEWPMDWGPDRVDRLISEARYAAEQAARWNQVAGMYRKALGRMIDEAGVKSLASDSGVARGVAGRRSARIAAIEQAVKRENLTDAEAEALILASVATLKVDALLKAIDEHVADEGRRKRLRVDLIEQGEGYVRVEGARRAAPAIEQEVVEPFGGNAE